MTKKQKAKQTKKQVRELLKNSLIELDRKIESSILCGCLSDDFLSDNFLLAKAIVSIHFKDAYRPIHETTKQEIKNLELFI